MGRPADYTQEVGDEICELLAKGKSLNSICKSESMPDDSTVYRWLLATHNSDLDQFRDNYALAREIQYQRMADELMDISDDGTNDYVFANTEEGDIARVNPEAIGRSRLRVDTRKWFMSKVLPKFKDKAEPSNPVVVNNIMKVPFADSMEQWEQASADKHNASD